MFEEFKAFTENRLQNQQEVGNPYSSMNESTKHELFRRWKRMYEDPIEFFKAIRTLDESATKNPIRPFPWRLDYIQLIIEILRRQQKVAIPKSRRMKISWTCQAFITWDGMFRLGRRQALVSKKEEDSDELVERCKFILDNLDSELFPRELIPQYAKTYCSLQFPDLMSKIEGFPSGADQLRQYTFSRLFGDEFAFWPNAQEMYSGAKPTLEGSDGGQGGQAILVSSRSPGFFKRLCYDKMDTVEDFLFETAQEELEPQSPMIGVDVWKNPKNQFCIIDLHYTADPAKRSEEWRVRESAGIPKAQWDREYEKSWDTYEGLPVYSDFRHTQHTARNLQPEIGLPLLRAWDFGLTPACVIAQLQGDQLVIFREFTEFNMGTERFSEIVLPKCHQLWPGFKWIDFIDPAGLNRDQSDEGQAAMILDSKGLQCIPGEITFDKRRKSVEHFLLGWSPSKNQPNLQVDLAGCPVLIRGFSGGYRYDDKIVDREPNKIRPRKDEHSHPHDALQYLTSGILRTNRQGRTAGTVRKQLSYSSKSVVNGSDQSIRSIPTSGLDYGRNLKRS